MIDSEQLGGTVLRARMADAAARFGLIVVMVGIIGLFSALRPNTYFTALNFETIATNQATTLLIALGVLLPLIAGEFDLSVAANFGFCQLLVAGLILHQGVGWVGAIILTLLVGGLIGLVNGGLVVLLKIDSFIATLAMTTILGGMTTWYSGGEIIAGDFNNDFLQIGQAQVSSLSVFVIYAVAVAALLWISLEYIRSGRHLYATGSGRLAAQLLGIGTGRLIIGAFALCGVIAALTGVITASQLGSGQPSLGASYLLPAYAAVFLGATTVKPGQFNVWGTVVAAYLLGAGVAGLQQLGMQTYVQDFFNGGALVIAVAASVWVTRRRAGGTGSGFGLRLSRRGRAKAPGLEDPPAQPEGSAR